MKLKSKCNQSFITYLFQNNKNNMRIFTISIFTNRLEQLESFTRIKFSKKLYKEWSQPKMNRIHKIIFLLLSLLVSMNCLLTREVTKIALPYKEYDYSDVDRFTEMCMDGDKYLFGIEYTNKKKMNLVQLN